MTIVVASASPEGIALASDSRTTQRTGEHHRVASDSAHKVFDFKGRAGIATYGMAMIGPQTIRDLFREWSASLAGELETIGSIGESLGSFFHEKLSATTPAARGPLPSLVPRVWPLGFLVAGYDDDNIGRILDVKIRATDYEVQDTEVTTHIPTVLYRGQTSVLRRLLLGVDLEGMREANKEIADDLAEPLSKLRYDLITPVTAQDAIDFAFFLIETTIKMQRYSDGTLASPHAIPACGGPIQCALVDPGGVSWIRSRNNPGPPAYDWRNQRDR